MSDSNATIDAQPEQEAEGTGQSEVASAAPPPEVTPAPVVEVTYPAAPPTQPAPSVPTPTSRKPKVLPVVLVTLAACLLVITGLGSYFYGFSRGRTAEASAAKANAISSALQVPKGAAIMEQCSVGRGTQYVLPTNIPHGPVFNVYRGKVIGVEYMIGQQDLASDSSFYDLPLYGNSYDHVDIGLQSKGHTGFPEPHYHVDIYNISRAASAAITCK